MMDCIQQLAEMLNSGQVDPKKPVGQFVQMVQSQQAPAETPGLGQLPQGPEAPMQ